MVILPMEAHYALPMFQRLKNYFSRYTNNTSELGHIKDKEWSMSTGSSTLTSALEQLRLKLLDLTGRNRLINFKYTAGKSLQFVEGQPSAIYQKLVESNNRSIISVLGLPEPARHDWVERNGRLQRPDPREWARTVRISTSYDISPGKGDSNVRALMYPDDLAKHCRKIEREATLAIEETGANMLFLVLGFLEFPDQRSSDKIFTAPLICIPVALIKKDVAGIQQFSLQYTGDDIAENLSLREKLRHDFGLAMPELPEEQIDVQGYFEEIETILKRQPGFALKHRVSLCLLNFSNMLLVLDLDPAKWPQNGDINSLIDHPIIRKVLEGEQDHGGSLNTGEEHAVEDEPGASIPLVYDADSSQHSALVDALVLKKNLVIEGPPGTGKSQTITNLIAACLAQGKRVLFVAEKLAALKVVKNRLSMAGLDPFVLELHSNKTNKKRVLEEISRRTAFSPSYPTDLPRLQKQIEAHRRDLKEYSDLINSVSYNAFGLTLHQVMWRAEKHRQCLTNEEGMMNQITIGDATQISEFELTRRMDCLGHLASQYKAIDGFDSESTFWGFFLKPIIPGNEVRLTKYFQYAQCWAPSFVESAGYLAELLGGKINNLSLKFCEEQLEVLKNLRSTANLQLPLHLIPGFFSGDEMGNNAANDLAAFESHVSRFHAAHGLVELALKLESSVTKSTLEDLYGLRRAAESLGVELGNLHELQSLDQTLTDSSNNLRTAITTICTFLDSKGIPFDASRQKLEQLLRFSNLVLEAPEEHFYLQTPGLTRDGSVSAIQKLLDLQNEWLDLEKELSEHLYLDTLPHEGEIKQAILTLREGDTWYRIFQGRWRRAVNLHKSLQRCKIKTTIQNRLTQLEKMIKLLDLKARWRTDPVWTQFLGLQAPPIPPALEVYLALARWKHAIKVASEELQVVLIDPVSFTSDQARALRREFSAIKIEITAAINAIIVLDSKLKRLTEFFGTQLIAKGLEKVDEFACVLKACLPWLVHSARDHTSFSGVIAGCAAALEREELKSLINCNSRAKGLLGDFYAGVDTDCSMALEALSFGQNIDGLNLSPQIKFKLRSGHPVETCMSIIESLEHVHTGLRNTQELVSELTRFGEFNIDVWTGVSSDEDLQNFADALAKAITNAIKDADILIPWSLYLARQKEARDLALSEFITLLESKRIKPDELADAYAFCTYSTITREAFRSIPQLGCFTGLKHNQIREEFKRLDKEIIALRGKAIGYDCVRRTSPPPGRNGARVDDKTEMVLLNLLMPQQRPRMPVRKILTRAGGAVQALKPCFMMGPQAVAQYLAPGVIMFDLVIMDEASQLKPEEAIGSIARGGQLVVVGDPKQLPPTTFFSRMSQTEDDDQFTTTDAESILDVCSSQFRPTRSLRWHYRSQHHSLIAFSNHYFYRGNLVIFPSPYGQGGKLGVRTVYLADAIYENQTNLREARRVVDAIIEHIASRQNESLGVVTLNIKQRDLIAELLEERLTSVRGADAYRELWADKGQPLFVKNLENVQGDERDAIIISTTFGKPPGSNAVRQNFGPISRQGGWRRLNVLFTRAKKSIAIYTSLRPEDIVMDSTTPDGTKALRNYLEYVRIGSLVTIEETGRESDSDFEISVMDMLKQRGYEVTPQLGVAGYRLDIAVKHPDAPGSYLAAIECDGASYHSALSVRDRDRIRQEILEALGWRGRIWRIWSTDWFRTPRQETEKLISFLEELRHSWIPEHASGEAWIEEGQQIHSIPSATDQSVDHVPNEAQAEREREAVTSVLIGTEDDLEVEVGDVVRYIDLSKPDDILTVQITRDKDDFANGIVNESRPLAQILLGAVVGDEVSLHLPGAATRNFQVVEIKRA